MDIPFPFLFLQRTPYKCLHIFLLYLKKYNNFECWFVCKTFKFTFKKYEIRNRKEASSYAVVVAAATYGTHANKQACRTSAYSKRMVFGKRPSKKLWTECGRKSSLRRRSGQLNACVANDDHFPQIHIILPASTSRHFC